MKVQEVNTKQVREKLESGGPLLLEFYATWCPHCHRMTAPYEEVADALDGQVSVWRIDGDENMNLAEELNVEGFPTFLYFEDGEIQRKTAGEMTKDDLLKELKLQPSAMR